MFKRAPLASFLIVATTCSFLWLSISSDGTTSVRAAPYSPCPVVFAPNATYAHPWQTNYSIQLPSTSAPKPTYRFVARLAGRQSVSVSSSGKATVSNGVQTSHILKFTYQISSNGCPSNIGTITVIEDPLTTFALTAKPTSGKSPLWVDFTAGKPDYHSERRYVLNFGDGTSASFTSRAASHVYTKKGTYTAVATASDVGTGTAKASVTISVGDPLASKKVDKVMTCVAAYRQADPFYNVYADVRITLHGQVSGNVYTFTSASWQFTKARTYNGEVLSFGAQSNLNIKAPIDWKSADTLGASGDLIIKRFYSRKGSTVQVQAIPDVKSNPDPTCTASVTV